MIHLVAHKVATKVGQALADFLKIWDSTHFWQKSAVPLYLTQNLQIATRQMIACKRAHLGEK
jgi:hypothetical protein